LLVYRAVILRHMLYTKTVWWLASHMPALFQFTVNVVYLFF